ncbi:MAG TPA: Uma2 family endonuclease, partial [Isosphaeraceae bacterium]
MPTAVEVRYTPEQYLALERKAEFKSEYVDREIHPMPGVSRWHSLIVGNLLRILGTLLLDRRGEAHSSDMRVRVGPSDLYNYPDIAVVAEEGRFEDAETDTLLNPAVVVEVLSPPTEAYDRGDKFARYRRLKTLQEYVLVSQKRV